MYIPINNFSRPINKISINESLFKEIVNEVLEEEFGSFKNQYDIGSICAKEAESMLNDCIYNKTIDIDCSEDISKIRIHIIPGSYLMRFVTVDPDENNVLVEIGEFNLRDEDSKNKLASSISHELMHGNVNLKIYHSTNKNALSDIPDYYDKLFDVMSNNRGKMSYYFAYGIYSTYFQEKNAFISQVSCEILDMFYNEDKKIDMSEFKRMYANTNSVITYKTNIEFCKKIETLPDGTINSFIVKPFKICNIDIDINDVRKKTKEILKYSKIALKDCRRNAMIAYNKIKEENGFIE